MIDYSDKRLLIIAPHPDDEVLMAGGLIQKVKSTRIVTMAVANQSRAEELDDACKILTPNKIESVKIFSNDDMRLRESNPMSKAVKFLDNNIDEFAPNIIVIPENSHHQDHRYTYEAALAACRPSALTPWLNMILIGSYPFSDVYPVKNTNHSYLYVRLGKDEFETKLVALMKHKSQLSGRDNDVVSLSSVRAIARMRGVESMCEYAERFEILRILT